MPTAGTRLSPKVDVVTADLPGFGWAVGDMLLTRDGCEGAKNCASS